MNGKRRRCVLLCLAIITSIAFISCPVAMSEERMSKSGVILHIEDYTSRQITVKEYDVTSLGIRISKGGVDVFTTTWIPGVDDEEFFIPITLAGLYDIEVTHNGVDQGETVSISESDQFQIQVGLITLIHIVPGMIGMMDITPIVPPEPPDLNGYWEVTWGPYHPLYTFFRHTGNDVFGAHEMDGYIQDDTLYISAPIIGTDFTISGTSTVTGDPLTGTQVIRDSSDNILFEGDLSMTPADQADFGHLDLSGNLLGSIVTLNTEWAMGAYSFDSGGTGPAETLDLTFFDDVYDIWIGFYREGTLPFGVNPEPYLLTTDMGVPNRYGMWVRYMIDGVIIIDEQLMAGDGLLTITEWDGTRAGGYFTMITPIPLSGSFNVPFTEVDFPAFP